MAKRFTPGGVFAFSHREPAVGQYGAQQMGGKWLEGREDEVIVYRWQHTAVQRADILKRHGFTSIEAEALPHPTLRRSVLSSSAPESQADRRSHCWRRPGAPLVCPGCG
ncbi:hypothetical protein ACFV0T_38125 [Streptomyces sp. NPDC059582]|uniref:hypothetical protein n=1 Tax=Streptomyces sp. NPDC059582 TaxID=3346875 RepID=UPI0036860EF0